MVKLKFIRFFLVFCCAAKVSVAQQILSADNISSAALELTKKHIKYDGSYYIIPYPGGDVPEGKGVCTDVIIRTYRAIGIDLQKEVHDDMSRYFSLYPKNWGLLKPDTNIDHRRVPNLMKYFERQGAKVPITKKGSDYLPGDIITWSLGGGLTHIGVVVNVPSRDKKRYKIVHNIGAGQVLEDCLFDYKIIGHYRFLRKNNIQ